MAEHPPLQSARIVRIWDDVLRELEEKNGFRHLEIDYMNVNFPSAIECCY